ncbi:MAG TPA: HD domain-containing phosphohydrolase, partial [Actinomycetota bacterium]|nr:HD domain-containing phosphohydrolase [Actinomycetota bacterium]
AGWPEPADVPALASVLIVDDDPSIRRLMARILQQNSYFTAEAGDAAEARRRLSERPYDAVLIDARMPGESGLELLRSIRGDYLDTAPIMVTALEDQQVIDQAFDLGAYGYVVKPFRTRELLINVTNALHRREHDISSRCHIQELEEKVRERSRLLQETIVPLPDPDLVAVSAEEVIGELAHVVTVRDEETGAHIMRMSDYSAFLAEKAGVSGQHPQRIRLAAALHDVGKIGIPDAVLLKPGPLTPEEFRVMQQHTVIGHDLLSGSQSPLIRLGALIALNHHERWDGTGYPNGLSGTAIPAEARVAAVADVFDALTSDRVYRPAFPVDRAVEMMRAGRATQFDPDLLDLFLGSLDDVLALRMRHLDPAK